MPASLPARRALVTGATGHVGSLLVPELLRRGRPVRVLARTPERLRDREWAGRVEVVQGDAADETDLTRALEGVDVAYYLLHSMDGEGDFVERDRRMARAFGDAARRAGVRRIVYLGGLHPRGRLSPHLASRVEVGEILLASGVPTAVLQAGVVLGAGSASFEMLRHLTERLPVVLGPRWLRCRIQPISDADVVHYLAEAADLPAEVSRTFDVGGPDVMTYAQMMRRYAAAAGLGRRRIATVPVLTPGLASHWVGLVTPVGAGIARPLVESLVHDAVRSEDDLDRLVAARPGGPAGFERSVADALREVDPTRWRRSLRRSGALVATAAVAGALLTDTSSRWYRSLDLPAWQPPGWAFPVAWTALYADLALVSALVTAEEDDTRSRAYGRAMLANLVLNNGWSAVFFRGHRPGPAAAVAGALTLSSADLVRRAAPTGRGRAAALAAYPTWCAFATALSAEIARRARPGRRPRARWGRFR